ncbi:MAG TPA: response regulator [Bryobacteraceae bacterium]|nr:response regulator [Bryobacteraceae bacterium]
MNNGTQPQILVVEDNGALRRLMLRILAGSGYSVLEASNGAQAVDLFRQHSPALDLAIVDMVMPGMSGLDVAAEMERLRPGMKILYISGYASSVAMESISSRFPDHVLIKPFDAAQLIDRVALLLKPAEPQTSTVVPPNAEP